ncbi:hypothetical protein [Actinokineospora globicatena]|uniref:hypothetical protein n=1 Tax=Actinokineospora globicatena TaxID=103729 RepID=UPI0020A51224|nr:hypothetical protein [Actinokineospora globicatena]MCP2306583.1 hypothetical protein [Actinokineospora globicatena]
MAITVERAGHALVLREPGADEQAATIAAALPEDRHRTAVVVGASAWPALARLDPWLVADLDDQVDTGVRLLAAHASSMSGGAVSLARRLADRLGVEVIAPDGDLYALTGGHTFAAGLGWVAHGAGSDRRPMGHRFPEPWWQGYLPAGHEEIPLGLWVRVPDAVTRVDDPLRWIQPDPERPTVVVGAPGEPAPSAADVAEVLDAFPPDVRGRVVLACYGADIAQAVARERGAAVRALHGLPSEHGLVHLDADGHFAWYPFAVESVYRPGCPPVLDRWVAPLPSLAMFAPARYRLAPGWSLDVLARGLLARPDTLIVDPALHTPTGPTPELLLACGPDVPDPVIATLTEVLDHLPATTKSTLRILPATPGATLAARTLAAHLVGTPRPPVAPWPEDHTQRISLDQWSIPLPRVTAGTSLLTPESLNLPEDLPTPDTPAPTTTASALFSTTPATHPQPGIDAGSAASPAPRLDSGAADSSPPAATPLAAAALLSSIPTTHPQPGIRTGPTNSPPPGLDSGAADSASPTGAHFPATVPTPPAAAALLSTTPATHPQPGFDAGTAHPQATRLDSGAAQPATPPGAHLPAAVTSPPIPASTVSSLSITTPPDAAIQPGPGREPEQAHPSATTPTPGTSAPLSTTPGIHPQPGIDAGPSHPQASRLDSGAAQSSQPLPTSAAIASLASVTSASVPASTGGLPLGEATPPKKPVASLAGLVPATSAPTDAEARPLPTLVPKPAPAIPTNAATPTEAVPTNTPVPADARSDEAQRRAVRSALGTRYDSATRAVVQLLAERPGLRASGDQATLLTELAVVRVFAEAPGPYDTAFHTCLTAGLRRLPTMRGVVVTGSSQPNHAEGALLRLEGPMLAVAQVGASVPGDTELLIWTTTARRLEGLLDADRRNDVVLPTHTALRVLGVEGNRLLLAEEGASAERALTNLRAAAAARAAVDVPHHPHPARWFGALPAA